MDIDLLLTIAHHLAVFTLVAIFAAEFALVRPGLNGSRLSQLAKIDNAYGAMAGAVIVVGVLRVLFGDMGWEYYVHNPVFWAKMAAIAVVGLLSIPPTLAFRGWLKAQTANGAYEPSHDALKHQRRFIHLQALFFLLIPSFAAAMARGYGA